MNIQAQELPLIMRSSDDGVIYNAFLGGAVPSTIIQAHAHATFIRDYYSYKGPTSIYQISAYYQAGYSGWIINRAAGYVKDFNAEFHWNPAIYDGSILFSLNVSFSGTFNATLSTRAMAPIVTVGVSSSSTMFHYFDCDMGANTVTSSQSPFLFLCLFKKFL